VASHCALLGTYGIVLEDFCGLSVRVSIVSASDDYSGGCLTNPTVPGDFRQVARGRVVLRRHAIVGCGSVRMPGVEIGLGASVGALSFVNKSVPEFMVVSGNPLRRVGARSRDILQREQELLTR
jgi:galactoside O-acetyltransferase